MSDFKAKMHKIRFPLGHRPRPRFGQLTAYFRGPTSKGRDGKREGMEREARKGEGPGPPYFGI